MKCLYNMGLRKKLFVMMLAILLVCFVLITLLGNTFFCSFYESSKIGELKKTANQLYSSYNRNTEQSWQDLYDSIFSAENRNSTVVIFRLPKEHENSLEIVYHSRLRKMEIVEPSAPSPSLIIPLEPSTKIDDYTANITGRLGPPNFIPAFNRSLLDRLPSLEIGESITDIYLNHQQKTDGGKIVLMCRLDNENYLMMETSREYINSVADLAVQYTAVVSLVVFFVGLLAIYYFSGRFTQPISEMEAVAKKISQLDFSDCCIVRSGDELGRLAGSINDMSQKLQSNVDRLVAANDVLKDDLARQQETDQMRRQFITDVSHDFKTPLTLMTSYAEAIRDMYKEDSPELEEYCNIIVDEGNKLSAMVGKLLKLSRLESGMDTPEFTVFSLNELLDDTIRAHRLLCQKKSLTVTKQYCGEVIVNADYHNIELVVANLFDNAVKYTPENGLIRIVTSTTEQNLCQITIENSGQKIDEQELDRIFTSFYRADRSRDHSANSYGLGLAIVGTILEQHHQTCKARNTPNGVAFQFTLPIVEL